MTVSVWTDVLSVSTWRFFWDSKKLFIIDSNFEHFMVFLKVRCFEKSKIRNNPFEKYLKSALQSNLLIYPNFVSNFPKLLLCLSVFFTELNTCNFDSMTLNLNILWTIPLLISWAFLSILSFKAVNCFKISSSASFHRFQAIKDRQGHLDLHKKPPERHKNRNPCFASNRCVVN